MFYDWVVKPQINKFLEEAGLTHLQPIIRKHKLQERFRDAPVNYIRKSNEITYNLDQLKSHHLYYPYLTQEEFLILSLLQQIGHHLHWEAAEEYLTVRHQELNEYPEKRFEIAHEVFSESFKYGLKHVPNNLKGFYEILNEIHLATYDETKNAERVKLEYLARYYRSIEPKEMIKPTITSLNKYLRWSKASWAEEQKSEILKKVLERLYNDEKFDVKHYLNDLMIILLKDKDDIRIIQHSHYNLEEPAISYLVDTSDFKARKNRFLKSLQQA